MPQLSAPISSDRRTALPYQASDWSQRASQRTWRTIGSVCIGIGLVNAFIPLLPTTVFLLIGVWAYGKGDPAMRERLMNHPKFGPSLRRWVDGRQISRTGKIAACSGIITSAALTAAMIGPKPITWVLASGLGSLCIYLASRPEPKSTL